MYGCILASPLTVICKVKPNVLSEKVTAGLDTIGLRTPSHPVSLQLLRHLGEPVAAPSANRSGKPSPTEGIHVEEDLAGRIPMIVDGGATGISLLVSALTKIPIYYLIPLINLPFIIMGHKTVGINFAVKTALAIGGLALVLANVDFPNVTNDNILVAVFGGFFLGAGIGLSIRGGAVIDGTEVLALYLSKKLGTTIGDIIIIAFIQ